MNNPMLNIDHKFVVWTHLNISIYEIIFGLLGFAATAVFLLVMEIYLQRRRKKRQNIKKGNI
jgi:hypothetical protein